MSERNYFVHESAYVDDPVEIGAGTKVWHFSHVQSNARIGERRIGTGAWSISGHRPTRLIGCLPEAEGGKPVAAATAKFICN